MESLQKPKYAVSDENISEVTSNYLFTGKCTTCKNYFERDDKHHCVSMNGTASSYKSVQNNFKEFSECPAYKKSSSANAGRFNHTILLFFITIGVVIYGLFTRPFVMLERYWFYGALGAGLTTVLVIHYLLAGNLFLSTASKNEPKTTKAVNIVSGAAVFIAYFLYHDAAKILSNFSMFTALLWIVFLFVLLFAIRMAILLFHAYCLKGGVIFTIIISFAAIVTCSIIFAVADFVLGIMLMVAGPHEIMGAEGGNGATGIR